MKHLPILLLFLLTACSTPAAVVSYAGNYNVTVQNTPLGNVDAKMILSELNGTLSGSMTANGETLTFKSVEKTDGGIRIEYYFPSYNTDVTMTLLGAPSAEKLTGSTLGEYPTTATRAQ